MYSLLRDDPQNELMRDRLGRLLGEVRQLQLSTREEFQATVFSRVNGVLALGNHMQPLLPVTAEGPATVGDVTLNLARLNQDATDTAGQLVRVETRTAQLYNLAAASQNALRQQIREALYASNGRRFTEAFVHARQLADVTATLDFNAGLVTLPVVDEVLVTPVITVGPHSDGDLVTAVDMLQDGQIDTACIFQGTRLELVLTFDRPEIINRLQLELDDYQGLEITALTSSPDGMLFDDVLADRGVQTVALNGSTGKYSGDCILDFSPRHAQQVRLVIEDRVGVARIALRSLSVSRRRYRATGSITTQPIYLTTGVPVFSTFEHVFAPFTTITHQISTDGVHFTNVTPGAIPAGAPLWYRALLQRSTSAFDQESSALVGVGDLHQTSDYHILRVSTVPVGAGMMERTLVLEKITGPIQLRDVPLPSTFRVQEGSTLLAANEYALSGGVLSFPVAKDQAAITVTYQTSALGAAALAARKEYYTPLLSQVRIEVGA